MSRINIRLNEMVTTAANVAVTVRAILIDGQSVVSGSTGILPGVWVKRTDETGLAFIFLQLGRYEISAQGAQHGGLIYRVLIDVPEDSNTYEHAALIVEGADGFSTPEPTAVPDATADVFGVMRLSSGGFGVAETVETIAAARTVGKARYAISKLCFVLGNAAAGDGGGGIYFWKAGGTDADDGAGFLRTSDYAGDGVLQKMI